MSLSYFVVFFKIYDIMRTREGEHIGKIKTQVHYLKPILFEEYKNLKTHEIAELVKNKIASKIEELKLQTIGQKI